MYRNIVSDLNEKYSGVYFSPEFKLLINTTLVGCIFYSGMLAQKYLMN